MTRLIARIAAAAALIVWSTWGPRLAAQNQTVVIQGATLIDGTGSPPLADSVILIEGNRFKAVGKRGEVAIPAGAKIIDASDKYLIPGLIDMHIHYRSWMPELLLSHGVTTIATEDRLQKEAIDKGKIPGPRMMINLSVDLGDAPFPTNMLARYRNETRPPRPWITDAEEIRRRTRAAIEEGGDIISEVGFEYTFDQIKVMAEEAARHGIKLLGHISLDAKEAALAGVKGLNHGVGIALACMKEEDKKRWYGWRVIDTGRVQNSFWAAEPKYDRVVDPRFVMLHAYMDLRLMDETIELLVDKGVAIEPDVSLIFREVAERRDEYLAESLNLLNHPDLAYIPPDAKFNMVDYTLLERLTPEELDLMKKGWENMKKFLLKFVRSGGKIIAGTDSSSLRHRSHIPGLSLHRELELYVAAGLTPMEALLTATKNPVEWVGGKWQKDLGTIEAGKLADLLILGKDPLADIRNTRSIEAVFKDGRQVDIGYHKDFVNPLANPYNDTNLSRPSPTRIARLEPSSVVEGSASFELKLRGSDFTSWSVVKFNGISLKTNFISESELRAVVPARLIRSAGTAAVTVDHPMVGPSPPAYFFITFADK